jgi:hypothetical protein
MRHSDLEISQEIRLEAMRQLVACAIAAAHRNLPNAQTVIDEMGKTLIQEWLKLATSKPLPSDSVVTRNTVITGFTEEISSVIALAGEILKKNQNN